MAESTEVDRSTATGTVERGEVYRAIIRRCLIFTVQMSRRFDRKQVEKDKEISKGKKHRPIKKSLLQSNSWTGFARNRKIKRG